MNNNWEKIVHSLWIGKILSPLEILTIKSFINNGYIFWLWCYNKIENVPKEIVIKDANEIFDEKKVFCYKFYNQYGHGKNSYAGFSDIFRYKLLYEYGGWWTDLDVTLLKPLNFNTSFVFRTHHIFKAVGNIMKCPPKTKFAKLCFENAYKKVNENNKDWDLPILILNHYIKECNLEEYIYDFTNPDKWIIVKKYIYKKPIIPDNWYAFHWINEEWKRHNISKKFFFKDSFLSYLFDLYNINVNYLNGYQKFIERFKLSHVNSFLKMMSKPKSFLFIFRNFFKTNF